MTPRRTTLTKVRTVLLNGFISVLLVLMLLQGLPLNMPAATVHCRYVADWIGIGHQPWNMYAPFPDSQNHRLTAQLMSSDEHVVATWTSPEWRKQSTYERFWGHRWAEYYDHVWMNHNADLWPALAQHIVKETPLESSEDPEPLKQVKLIAETKSLSPPAGAHWPRPIPPEGYDDNWVLSIEPLPTSE